MSGVQWTTKGMLATIAILIDVMGSLDERQAEGVAEMLSAVVEAPELAALPFYRDGLREWVTFCRSPREWSGPTMGANAIEALRRYLDLTRDALAQPHLHGAKGEAQASA